MQNEFFALSLCLSKPLSHPVMSFHDNPTHIGYGGKPGDPSIFCPNPPVAYNVGVKLEANKQNENIRNNNGKWQYLSTPFFFFTTFHKNGHKNINANIKYKFVHSFIN